MVIVCVCVCVCFAYVECSNHLLLIVMMFSIGCPGTNEPDGALHSVWKILLP